MKGNADIKRTIKETETKEQQQTLMAKLQNVLQILEEHKLISDLNEAFESDRGKIPGAFCYKYRGRFECRYQRNEMIRSEQGKSCLVAGDDIRQALEQESGEKNEDRLWQHNCLLVSRTDGLTIELAASLKYFAKTEWNHSSEEFLPTSSNDHFFRGQVRPLFDVLFFRVGTSGNVVYGTALAIVYNSQEDVRVDL